MSLDIVDRPDTTVNGSPHAADTLVKARSYHRAGLAITPVRMDGSKAPALTGWPTLPFPTEAQLENWFDLPRYGLGIRTGKSSGNLELLDFDIDAAKIFVAWSFLIEKDAPGLLAKLCVIKTPRVPSGFHVWYRCSGVVIPGNDKLAQSATKQTLIETRGEGGQGLAPGCPAQCHPAGGLYQHHAGPELENVQDISPLEREILFEAARSFNELVEESPTPPRTGNDNGQLRPGDDYNQRGPSFAEVMEPHGWTKASEVAGTSRLRRPGKEQGWSATAGRCKNKDGVELLYVFSSSAQPFASGKCYNRFAVYTFLNHGGDFKAAAKELRRQGFGAGSAYSSGPSQTEDRPSIYAREIDLQRVTSEAWRAIHASNAPPTLFRYGAMPARIENDDNGQPIVRTVDIDRMRHRLARNIRWFTMNKAAEKTDALPPLAVVRDVLACPDPPLPILTRIVQAPIFAADGTLQTEPGYSPAAKTFFAATSDFQLPPVSASPSQADVEEARNLLLCDLLGDFPFVSDADRAHALAGLLCPFAREMIHGPTPLHGIEAPGPGMGKTLLTYAITLPALGTVATAMTEARDEDEWRKRLFAKLLSAPSVVFIDNVRRRVDSGALSSALTAFPLWEDRLLGKSESIKVPIRCSWFLTANNPSYSSEMTRRTIRIRLDAKQDQPWMRKPSSFRHSSLLEWAKENRARLVAASLTLVQAWVAAGRPQGTRTVGMYESWTRTLGGILTTCGVAGFLGNLEDFYKDADDEGATWRSFIAAWWETFKENDVGVVSIFSLAVAAGMPLGDKGEHSQRTLLGRRLREARDRVFRIEMSAEETVSLAVQYVGAAHGTGRWRLKKGT